MVKETKEMKDFVYKKLEDIAKEHGVVASRDPHPSLIRPSTYYGDKDLIKVKFSWLMDNSWYNINVYDEKFKEDAQEVAEALKDEFELRVYMYHIWEIEKKRFPKIEKLEC